MSQKKRKSAGRNPDPERFELVRCKEGDYYRRKRAPGPMNEGMQRSAEQTRVCSPAARRLVGRLRPWLEGLSTGRVTVGFAGRLKKPLNRAGRMDYRFFEDYDLQDPYPLAGLLDAPYRVEVREGSVEIGLDITRHTLKLKNTLVSHYFLEAVLVWGDPGVEGGLRVDSATSPLYPAGAGTGERCRLSLELPEGGAPWMVLLKVSSLEGHELAVHPRHYGMRVVKVS